ncbi:Nuclear pore [Hyphodiscus hymeniophilus]|uniref:Nuclear pore n=1 Tax=Hyphodiscus hymeniophilus TaxID=353542 RepID=A0A9P6VJ90_9HELO|nr:Nuclear pore [Hyphodiscus hymeniophilus]
MIEPTSLETLHELHADLLALSESRLLNIERLEHQLTAHIKDFQGLLDRKPRSGESRRKLETGKLELEESYSVNQQFQQTALQVADDLDIDELDAARICLEAQIDSETSGRSLNICSILRFHQRRIVLLDCLRLILQFADDIEVSDEQGLVEGFRGVVAEVVQAQDPSNISTKYVARCFASMLDIKACLQKLMDKLSGASVIGKELQPELDETTEYQRMDYSSASDFELVLERLRTADKYDHLLLHYIPTLTGYISHFLSPGRRLSDARALNDRILSQSEQRPWTLTYVHAAIRAWWLADFSGWLSEHRPEGILQTQQEEENKQRTRQFSEALKDGAFDFILSLSADVKSADWHDPARHGLRQWLQRKAPFLPQDSIRFAEFFHDALEEQVQSFIEAFIQHMHEVLRRLRLDEDEQRQLSNTHDHELDLERFIVTISFSFEGRPTAAREAFWDAPDGALLGFLHWASRRASTPLVSSFCEMLKALSEDQQCATFAHEFLLDEATPSSGRARRTHSLTWNQIFKELNFFCSKIRDRPSASQTNGPGKPSIDHVEMEPESFLMLECYLRLITQLCEQSQPARQFLTQHPSFHLTDLLFQLTSSSIQPRLKACAFATLKSLLSHKTKETSEYLWTALDVWVSGGFSPGSTMPKPASTDFVSSAARILRDLGTGFEEPNSFVQFLHALVLPYDEESGLRDGLPFPENLGASSRMPGIEPYVDFVVGQIFGSQTTELNDVIQARLLRLSCLQFITVCLESFNEDLVVFANRSNVVVDAAIETSNLQTYVMLHPFSRVMEWMYSEKVMGSLFASIQQNDAEQSTSRRAPVSNASFSTFEDGILNHLSIIPDLGLYCGSGHPELVVASLRLLEKISASPKLVSGPSTLGRGAAANKAIAALQNDAGTISMTLLHVMESSIDINQGPESPEHVIKIHILDFLIACIQSSLDQPSIAHLILGFQCGKATLDIGPASHFNQGISLFHTILGLALEGYEGEDNAASSWLVSFKLKCLQILKLLWQSPLSSKIVMNEMRTNQAIFLLFAKQQLIMADTRFDGLELVDAQFLPSDAASCLCEFLTQRSITLQYVSAELRQVSSIRMPSLKQRLFAALLGTTTADDGSFDHASIFDLFDFMDIEYGSPEKPQVFIPAFNDIDLDVCQDVSDESVPIYNLGKVKDLLLLRRSEFFRSRPLPPTAQEEADVNKQIMDLIEFHSVDNQVKLIWESRLRLLQSWTQVLVLMIQTGDFDGPDKTAFVLRTLQTILPWLENNLSNVEEATELAKLAKCLIFTLDFDSDSFKQGDMGDLVSERLHVLFQVSLQAITSVGANPALKECFYSISYRFLTGMSDITGIAGVHQRPSMQTIRAAGDRFVDIVCDDAYAGEPLCRISALLLLSALVEMAKRENVNDAVDALARLNFIAILVDSIKNMPTDLRETARQDVPLQLSYCHTRLLLLRNISQTRYGATAVLNAGLFNAIQISGLFATDTDLGVVAESMYDPEIDDLDAVKKHWDLLSSIMRVICASVLSRGSQNEHTLEQGRNFLKENRLSIVEVLKKSAGLVGENSNTSNVDELAEAYMLLMTVTRFLEGEKQQV